MAPAKQTPAAPVPAVEPPRRGVRRVSESFFAGNDLFSKGMTIRAGHPVIEQYPQFFAEPGLADVELPE
jgi:hypothetical protein